MFLKKSTFIIFLTLFMTKSLFATQQIGIVNFAKCITDSKYGKKEQTQIINIKNQWSKIIEETEKELESISINLENQEYLDSISPETEENLRLKQQTLNSDLIKYQNQLYQIMQQAQFITIQKLSSFIAKASKEVSSEEKLQLVINQEACFSFDPKLEITDKVIRKMDRSFAKDTAENEESPNKKKKEIAQNEKEEKKK